MQTYTPQWRQDADEGSSGHKTSQDRVRLVRLGRLGLHQFASDPDHVLFFRDGTEDLAVEHLQTTVGFTDRMCGTEYLAVEHLQTIVGFTDRMCGTEDLVAEHLQTVGFTHRICQSLLQARNMPQKKRMTNLIVPLLVSRGRFDTDGEQGLTDPLPLTVCRRP